MKQIVFPCIVVCQYLILINAQSTEVTSPSPQSLLGRTVKIIKIPPIHQSDKIDLNSSVFNYPDESADIIWIFSHSIEIEVNKLKINGNIGDFVLFSKYTFPEELSNDTTVEEALEEIPIGESRLYSWNIDEDSDVVLRLYNPNGVSIYFHGEESNNKTIDYGILMKVSAYDIEEEPTTTVPTTSTIPPGQNPEEDYVTKYVIGRTPRQFIRELDNFKSILTEMTYVYCDKKGFNISIPELNSEDSIVHIPEKELRFCHRSWPEFKNCVEVTFAIVIYDQDGIYIMTGSRIDEMWGEYKDRLIANNYHPYDPPPKRPPVSWLWVAGCLGSVLVISILLCITWMKRASDEFKKEAEISSAISQVGEEETFYDRRNPVHQIRKTMINGRLENNYRPMNNGDEDYFGSGNLNFTSPFSYDEYDGGSMKETYRINQLYVPDEDEEDEIFSKSNRNPEDEWHEHINLRSPNKKT